jgi:hypothetical protein
MKENLLRRQGIRSILGSFIMPQKSGRVMTEQEAAKQSADLLRKIIRSIDKNLTYTAAGPPQEGQFSLRLATRGREGLVCLRTSDLRSALTDDVQKNGIRQKIKNVRDHLVSRYVPDVMGKTMARTLKQPKAATDGNTSSYFSPRGGQRRR